MNGSHGPIDSMYTKMVLIANLYYKDKLSQQEIAQKLQLSRPWVSKLLARAEEVGIVKIEVRSPYTGSTALSAALTEKYALEHACVVERDADGDALARTAADYFLSILRSRDVVGVGWGTSVSRLIAHVPQDDFPQVQVVPLAGSFGNSISHFPNYSAMRLSETLRASARVLHTPALCVSQEEYNTLMANDTTCEVLHMAEHADILLLGIGALADSISPQYGAFGPEDIRTLKEKHVIGDVALQYFDAQGKPADIEAASRLIKADIFHASANARVSLGIAEGLHKVRTIDAALRLKLVNVLFTGEATALALLSL